LSAIIAIVLIFLIAAAALGAVAFVVYRQQLRKAKGIERGLKMVPILIHLPPPSDDTVAGSRDLREVMREKTAQAEVLYNLIAGTAQTGFRSHFYGQRHIAFELIASEGLIHFYAAVPVGMISIVEKAIMTAYPGARLEEVEDHNIFSKDGRIAGTLGGELALKSDTAYPIATFKDLERDPMEALLNTLGTMQPGDGAAIQIMLRPANPSWVKRSTKLAMRQAKAHHISGFTAKDIALAALKPPAPKESVDGKVTDLSNLEKTAIEAIEEKTKHIGYEVLIRIVVSTNAVSRSQTLISDISTAFALFEAPGSNGFKFLPSVEAQGLVTAFIFRFFPPELTGTILNSVELATLFHLPDQQFTPTTNVERQTSKQVDGPVSLPTSGLLFGYNEFRGVRKEIRLSESDRRRHTYIIGQTGTGKSGMLENLIVQDMLNGNGLAFIDPHGDTAEKLLSMVPKERAEDVIYFNPADTDYPLGFNLFEFTDPQQKDFIIQESINMLIKIYDPGGTGVIGPRFEQWFRNAALTLMSDPNGSTFIEIPKVFTDTEYLKKKFRYLKDPTVIEFWTKEMGQTSDYHKSEMLGYFVSKFGAFLQNETLRNILGQTKSAFNLRDVMDQKKILIVNLSKGQLGELNSKLLGMMFVMKFQAAAMSRADMPEDQRKDFCLYVDEFQNFATDSFASILSEARKYRLNLIVANQFIGQLTPEIRDAVFGNIGSIVAHRMGPEDAEFMVKQFTPVFDIRDLINLPNFHAAMRLMVGGLPSQPFTMSDLPYLKAGPGELREAIKQLSAAKFGATRAQVEADLFSRLDGKTAPVSAPPPKPVVPTSAPVPAAAPPLPAATTFAAPPSPPVASDPTKLSLGDITGGRPAPALVAAPAPAAVPPPPPSRRPPAAAPITPAHPTPAPVPVVPLTPPPPPTPIVPEVPLTPPAPVVPEVPLVAAPVAAPMPMTAVKPKQVVGRPHHTIKHLEGHPKAIPVAAPKPVAETPPPAEIEIPAEIEAMPKAARQLVIEPPAGLPDLRIKPKIELSPEDAIDVIPGTMLRLVEPETSIIEPKPELPKPEPKLQPTPISTPTPPTIKVETRQSLPEEPPTLTPVDAAVYTAKAQDTVDKLVKTKLIHPDRTDKPIAERPESSDEPSEEHPPISEHHSLVLEAPDALTPMPASVIEPAPVVVTPEPAVIAPAVATVEAPPSTEPTTPKLEPGEVFVDDLGNVHIGE
jgi:hypothetical protein